MAIAELTNGTAMKYCQEMNERIQQYNDDSLKTVEVKEIKHKSKLLYLSDIGTDSEKWPNTSLVKYYKKEKIYLVK